MVFALDKKLALPADLKVGDKVQVRVEDLGGALTVTSLTR
jgi:Cu(I)/Ag(I) efflux system periplasmic protein CusF